MNNLSTVSSASLAPANFPSMPAEEAFERELDQVSKARLIVWRAINDCDMSAKTSRDALAQISEFQATKAKEHEGHLARLRRPATRKEISEHLAALVGCYPSSNVDPAVFTRMLSLDVGAQQPSVGALERACRSLRRKSVYLPKIAEILPAIEEAEKGLQGQEYIFARLPEIIDRGTQALASEERYRKMADEREIARRNNAKADIRRRLDEGKSVHDCEPDLVEQVRKEIADGPSERQGMPF